jgi:LysR family pca operon transcriptional activator
MPKAMTLFLAEHTGSRVKIVTGENAVLLEQLRVGDLDLVVGRLSGADKMAGFSFEHLYSEPVVFAVRPGHPLLGSKTSLFAALGNYVIIMPTKGSIIRPIVENFLVANGVASLPHQIETVSDSFGRAFVRSSDAVWIISRGVVASDVGEGFLAMLPIEASETKGPVGLTMRADAIPSIPLLSLMQTIREAVLSLSAPSP